MKYSATAILVLAGILITYEYLEIAETNQVITSILILCVVLSRVYLDLTKDISNFISRLDNLGDGTKYRLSIIIFLLSFAYFFTACMLNGRGLHPIWHDDQMHAVQVRMLANGVLWTQPHPMAEFFDTFHIFVNPVYAPIHFPGTALLNTPSLLLHLPIWLTPMMLVSAASALSFHISSKIFRTSTAILVPLFFLTSSSTYMLSAMITSHNAMMFLGLLWLTVYFRWERNKKLIWAAIMGGLAGLCAITRPVDAIAYTAAITIGVVANTIVYRQYKLFTKTAFIAILAAVPFIVLQLYFDKGVTGSWLLPPYKAYNDKFHPYTSYASERFLNAYSQAPIVSNIPQKQDYYEQFMLSNARFYLLKGPFRVFTDVRIPMMLQSMVPDPSLYFVVPAGLIGLTSVRKWVVVSPMLFFLILYYPHIYFFDHYPPVVGTSIAVLTLLGFEQFKNLFPTKFSDMIQSNCWLLVVVASALALQPFSKMHKYEFNDRNYPSVDFTREQLPSLVQKPALVFFSYDKKTCNIHDEPVYNYDTVNPDDAKIVLAQSLGDRNIELIRYYNKLGQNRHVYLFNRSILRLSSLGDVNQIIEAQENKSSIPDGQ